MADQYIQQGNQAVSEADVKTALNNPNATALATPPVAVPPVSPIKTSTTIPVDQIKTAPTLNLPTTEIKPDTASSLVAGATQTSKSIADYMKELEAPQTDNQKEQSGIIARLKELLPNAGGKAQALADEEVKNKVPELRTQLSQINSDILTKSAEYQKLLNDTEKASTLKGSYSAKASEIKRTSAAEIGLLQARALGLQGQVSTAMDIAARAVDLKYEGIEDEINLKLKQLEIIQPLLNADEKKQSQATQLKIDADKQALQDKKDMEKQINNVMIEAARYGADNETLSKVQKSQSIGEAITNSGNFLGAEFREKLKQQSFDNNLKLQELNLSRARLALEKTKLDADTPDIGNLVAYAQQYASTGTIPTGMPKGTFGTVSEIAKSLPKPNGTLVDKNTGIKPSSLSSTQLDGITALYDLQGKLDQAKTLFNDYNHGLVAGLKNQVLPSKTKQEYGALRNEITDLLARARTGAAITAYEEQQYASKLPGDFNKFLFLGSNGNTSIASLKNSLTGKLDSTLSINGASIYGYSTVKIGDESYKVGDIVSNGEQSARVNPDGSLSLVNE
jgi:hypothetical protein